MNIFDAHITGSLSVSSSAEISGDLTVLGTINATISGTTSNAISASHAANYTLTSSFGNFTSSYTTGSFTGSFIGDGSGLSNIPASGVTGLNLTQIADGSVTASVSDTNGLRVNSKSEITGSLIVTNGITGSIDYSNITNKPTLVSGSSQIDVTSTTGYSTFSSSISTSIGGLSSSISSSIGSLSSSIATTDLNQNGRLDSIETSTGSLNSFTSSIGTTIKNKLDTENVVSSSVQVLLSNTSGYLTYSSSVSTSIGSLSSSLSNANFIQDGQITSIINKTGSYATTGSNVFIGDQSVTGSLIITQNLQVLGSSSFLYVTSSQLNVSSSTISVNVFEPAERFGGLKIYDSGSSAATASFLWDSLNNRFVYQNVNGASYNGAMFIAGPRNSGSLGDESALTSGKIPKSVGGDHIDNSIMSEVGGNTIAISGSLVITGSILSTGTSLVSGSGQVISLLPTGTVSGSSQILLSSGIWSGSAQLPSGVVSGSSQVLLSSGVWSGSAQLPSGVVSGSSQVLTGTGIWSGSAQLPSGVISGSAQLPSGTVSGSSQIIAGLPSGTISGSSQVTGIGNSQLTNSSFYLGSTSISLGRSSATLNLSGVNTDGYAASLNGYANQTIYTILDGPANGPVIKIRYDSATANRYIDFGSKDGNGVYSEGLKIYNSDTLTFRSNTIYHSGNIPTWNQNTTGTASNITAYTINQNLGTGNSPTFAGLTSNNSATLYRDVYINGGTSGNYGNRLLIGDTTATYTLQDTNLRPTIYMSGAYPVLTLNHTQTSNASHGPTIQFTHYTADKQWVIGTNGTGTQMDFGYSSNTNRNPHNGIDNYQGNTYLRISNSGNITTWANIIPSSNGTLNLGGSSNRWNTVFTSDLSLSNGIGDYTIVEGENDLFLYNNKQNKVYKFMLQEVNPSDATPKRPE